MADKRYAIYIMASRKDGTLYTGVTNNLTRRVWQHKQAKGNSFVARHGVTRLVYYDYCQDVRDAIAAEKRIKAGKRAKKVERIVRDNPDWKDLAAKWYG